MDIQNKNKKHQKHVKLTRTTGGHYHMNEWSFIGAPCGVLQQCMSDISNYLKDYQIGLLEADHQASEWSTNYTNQVTDKIQYFRLDSRLKYNAFDLHRTFRAMDMVFVNGNHFAGDRQIVFIHPKKEASLQKKLDRLNNVFAVVLTDETTEIYDFLKPYITADTPIFKINALESLATNILDFQNKQLPKLRGLILAGGKSTRMGEDKGEIVYHGKAQRLQVKEMLDAMDIPAMLSLRSTQQETLEEAVVQDRFYDLGPMGGILSAFMSEPNQAWLTIACDMPQIDEAVIRELVNHRNPSKLATSFYNPDTKFPEPLCTIWEPRAYPILLDFLARGYSCPRKVLINSDVELVHSDQFFKLKNINTPEERKAYLGQK